MKIHTYHAKGYIWFVYTNSGMEFVIEDKDTRADQYQFHRAIYDLMSGSEFLESVQNKNIMGMDGHIADIFVNGYISNLGL